MTRVTARPLELLVVPGLDRLRIGETPALGLGQHVRGIGRQFVDDALLLRGFRVQFLAFEHQRVGVGQYKVDAHESLFSFIDHTDRKRLLGSQARACGALRIRRKVPHDDPLYRG